MMPLGLPVWSLSLMLKSILEVDRKFQGNWY
ncbi:hypothetical protein Patl1_20578 [Pistacia atlantica]|uniref:Uncharacterized protein n=1 Tax=Pistacia atlantica TaxID=434234 RepID=A0ACC1BMJ9_9ROSI|nr:hypothetical protein Patl1_20578 [Pistacia atlantica]